MVINYYKNSKNVMKLGNRLKNRNYVSQVLKQKYNQINSTIRWKN